MVFKNGVKHIQAAAYNGARTVVIKIKKMMSKWQVLHYKRQTFSMLSQTIHAGLSCSFFKKLAILSATVFLKVFIESVSPFEKVELKVIKYLHKSSRGETLLKTLAGFVRITCQGQQYFQILFRNFFQKQLFFGNFFENFLENFKNQVCQKNIIALAMKFHFYNQLTIKIQNHDAISYSN